MAGTDYSAGDYRVVAQRLRPAAVELVAWCAPRPGSVVLDSASGTGNVALECHQRGCQTLAIDLEIAQLRALAQPAEGRVHTVVGDVMRLPLAARTVDHVLSAFGMVYAPDPGTVAAEAARVCRPGGFVALTSWAEDGFQPRARAELARAESAVGQYVPEIAPAWTSISALRRTLAPLGDVEVRNCWLETRVPSAAAWWEQAAAAAPPVVAARARLSPAAFDHLGEQLRRLVEAHSERSDGGLVLREEYLLARARVQ
jgi:ubiquinone/menaquinone biosynthesis C-methylase UbiE